MAGRPREFDRGLALERARDLFWTRGYEGTSMADLVNALGIASARIYAAFGSKEALFREAIEHYESEEGGFAERALSGAKGIRSALEEMFREAIALYTKGAKGCMVVSSATNCAQENEAVGVWLAQHRKARTQSIIDRLSKAKRSGEIPKHVDEVAAGDCCATLLHGLSVQARDGVKPQRLHAMVDSFLTAFDTMIERPFDKEQRF
ncbi:TetR family transcriptional regulator [Bradyrhizobium sp. NAS80.1]|uniref:TetR/AcrR family transcriptional regulator n=1 Tax=Bradyrhizobium sp. NAS80.1 TaxID=1680159 RepID=UPI00095BBE98|nr:TetR/AcrR family transcriptional regulator [Bradyrhizobium sp. NAS80.1]OKO75388.1 TetR family transcriptional regulator [Bradyrhizobium sp. NAS80.1]